MEINLWIHILLCHTINVYSSQILKKHLCRNIEFKKKPLSHNRNLNFLYNLTNYNKLYDWKNHNWFDVNTIVMYYHQSSRVHQQMLNFFPIPHAVMNEPFYETTEHYCLRDMVHMFTLHICPMATQESYEHCNKIYTWTCKKFSIVTLYCLSLEKILQICPYLNGKTSIGGEIVHC
jgi:hypothetical protein